MILTILGWSWVALGIWWVLRPQGVKKRFGKRFRGLLRWAFMLILFCSGGLLFSAGRELDGILGIVLPVAGVIVVIKGLFFLRGKASDAVLSWWEEQPIWVYRLAGLLVLLSGLLLQWIASGRAGAE